MEIVEGGARYLNPGATGRHRILLVVATWREDRERVVTVFELIKPLIQFYCQERERCPGMQPARSLRPWDRGQRLGWVSVPAALPASADQRHREYPHPPPPSRNNTRTTINTVVIFKPLPTPHSADCGPKPNAGQPGAKNRLCECQVQVLLSVRQEAPKVDPFGESAPRKKAQSAGVKSYGLKPPWQRPSRLALRTTCVRSRHHTAASA